MDIQGGGTGDTEGEMEVSCPVVIRSFLKSEEIGRVLCLFIVYITEFSLNRYLYVNVSGR